MAKKRAGSVANPQPPLDPDWVDEIPEEVQIKVDEYLQCMRAKNKAAEKFRNAKEACQETMLEHGIKRLRVDNGETWLIAEDAVKLKTKKVNLEKDDTRQSVTA